MSGAAPLDLLCLGEVLVEFNQTDADTFRRGFGGDTSNCAIAAARQGARVGYLTRLGADDFGEACLALWAAEGVDVSGVRRDAEAHTGVYFVTHTPDGHRFDYLRRGSAASRLTSADVDAGAIARSRWLHLSGISQAISDGACDAAFHAMAVARGAGVQIAYDTNLRLGLWPLARARAVIHAAVSRADVLLPGLDDARLLCGVAEPHAIVDRYLGMGPSVVALTLGANGVLVATAARREHLPAHPVRVVDATGAGDAFDGAFLARLAAGDDPFTAACYANVAAALSTTGYGAVAPIPTRAAVLAALAATPAEGAPP